MAAHPVGVGHVPLVAFQHRAESGTLDGTLSGRPQIAPSKSMHLPRGGITGRRTGCRAAGGACPCVTHVMPMSATAQALARTPDRRAGRRTEGGGLPMCDPCHAHVGHRSSPGAPPNSSGGIGRRDGACPCHTPCRRPAPARKRHPWPPFEAPRPRGCAPMPPPRSPHR
jgi:hypothetical protein